MEAIFLHIPTQLQSQRGNSPIGKMAHFGGVGRLYHINRIFEPWQRLIHSYHWAPWWLSWDFIDSHSGVIPIIFQKHAIIQRGRVAPLLRIPLLIKRLIRLIIQLILVIAFAEVGTYLSRGYCLMCCRLRMELFVPIVLIIIIPLILYRVPCLGRRREVCTALLDLMVPEAGAETALIVQILVIGSVHRDVVTATQLPRWGIVQRALFAALG